MTAAVQIIFPPAPLGVQNAIDTIAQLRALDSTEVSQNTEVLVASSGFYKFSPSSLVADNGTTIIKPNDLTTLQAGRWLSVAAFIPNQPLTPENYGAVGNGIADDSAALNLLFAACQSTGLSAQFKAGATYGLGAASWTGLSRTLTRKLEIDANGAGLVLLYMPTQAPKVGAGNSVFKFDGTAAKFGFSIRNIGNFDSGGMKAILFDLYRCTIEQTEFNHFTNGDMGSSGSGDASIPFFCNACTGLIGPGNTWANMGYFTYGGHTDVGMYSDGLNVIGNGPGGPNYRTNSANRGDFFVGVIKNAVIAHNRAHGVFGGCGLAGLDTMYSENVEVHDNVFSDFTASGVQSDNYGTAYSYGLNVHDNILNDASGTGVPISMVHVNSSQIRGNSGRNAKYGITWDAGSDVVIEDNHFDAGTASSPIEGLSIKGQIGPTTGGLVQGNYFQGHAANIAIGGAGSAVSDIDILGNKTKGGARGIFLQETGPGPTTNVFVDANDFAGSHSTFDIDNSTTNGLASVQFGTNKFATSNGVSVWRPKSQPTPTAKTANATLTITELQTGIVTVTSASAVALTLPTGTLTDAGLGGMSIGMSFDWAVINLGSASGAVTMTAGVGHTYVGAAVVAITTTAQFRTTKTAANTFVTYRIA